MGIGSKSGLSLVYLKKELFKFSLNGIMHVVPSLSCKILRTSPLHFAPLVQIYSVSELQKVV